MKTLDPVEMMGMFPDATYADIGAGVIDFGDEETIKTQLENQIVTVIKDNVLGTESVGLTADDVDSLYSGDYTDNVKILINAYVQTGIDGLRANPDYKGPEEMFKLKQPELVDIKAELDRNLKAIPGLVFRDKQTNAGLKYQLIDEVEDAIKEADFLSKEELKEVTDLIYSARTPEQQEAAFLSAEVQRILSLSGFAGQNLIETINELLGKRNQIEALDPSKTRIRTGMDTVIEETEKKNYVNNFIQSLKSR